MAGSLPCAAETQHYKAITLQFKKTKTLISHLVFTLNTLAKNKQKKEK